MIGSYHLSVDVSESGEAHCMLLLTYGRTTDVLGGGYLVLPGRASHVAVTDDEGALKFSSTESASLTEVRFLFRYVIPEGEEYKVTVEFWTFDLSRKDQDEWVLEVAYEDPPSVGVYSFEAILPSSATYIPGDETWVAVQAEGDRIVLADEGVMQDISLGYSLPSDRTASLPDIIITAIVFLVGLLLGYLMLRPSSTPEQEPDVMRFLDSSERKVYKALKKENSRTRQSSITETTGLPKSTVSRTLERLERKGLIKKERHGREYEIILP